MTDSSSCPFPQTINTPRLTLEIHSKTSDQQYQSMIKCLSTPQATKFISFDNLTSSADVDKIFIGTQLEWKLFPSHGTRKDLIQQDCVYHIRPKSDHPGAGALVGFVLLVQRNDGIPPDEGWFLMDEYNGHGYATEAAKGLLDFATDVLGIREVIAWPKESNVGSVKVAERIGLTRSGQILDRKTGEVRVVLATEGSKWPPFDGILIPEGRQETQNREAVEEKTS